MQDFQMLTAVLLNTEEPALSFTHHYKGFGIHKSWCKVEVYIKGQHCLALFINGEGTSITNSAEQLLTEIYNTYLKPRIFHPNNCFWAETYDRISIDMIAPKFPWSHDGNNYICEGHYMEAHR